MTQDTTYGKLLMNISISGEARDWKLKIACPTNTDDRQAKITIYYLQVMIALMSLQLMMNDEWI
ncbi:MAG: hypothetical protein V8S55_04005 [Mediterraneibacter faecis]